MYIHTYSHRHIHTHTHIYRHTYTLTQAHTHLHTYIHRHIHIHTCIHRHAHTLTQTCTHTHSHRHIHYMIFPKAVKKYFDNSNLNKSRLTLSAQFLGYCPSSQGSYVSRSRRHCPHCIHNQEFKRLECWSSVPFYPSWALTPFQGKLPPKCRVTLVISVKPIYITPHRHAQRFVSNMIPKPVKLIVNINYHNYFI